MEYLKPEVEYISLETLDILTSSSPTGGGNACGGSEAKDCGGFGQSQTQQG